MRVYPSSSANVKLNEGKPPPRKRPRLSEPKVLSTPIEHVEDGIERKDVRAGSHVKSTEIPDSESESGDDDFEDREVPAAIRLTDLENALPPIKSDQEAIDEYEATRSAEHSDDPSLKTRLSERKWTRGKNSIYVDAFNLALDTVLADEAHLFDEAELAVFDQWRQLEYQAQYLYVRLFLRKTAAWHRLNRLGYHGDIGDLVAAADHLQQRRQIPRSTAEPALTPGEVYAPVGMSLADAFTFADTSSAAITTLEEASTLLSLEELRALAKEAKSQGKNKREMLASLRDTSKRQSGLHWAALRRTESHDSSESKDSTSQDEEAGREVWSAEDAEDHGVNRDGHFLRKILASTGPCIRLSTAALKLFERVHLVFYRSTEWTEKSLTTIILARISRRNFPTYLVSRSSTIFSSRSLLLEFEAAIRTQFRVDNILEFNGNPTKKGLLEVLALFEDVYPRWQSLLEQEQQKEDRVYESSEGAYLRRFSPAWVYTRIVHKGAHVLGRLRDHRREHEVLSELLAQRLFHTARRGVWYQRKALVEEHYMANLTLAEGQDLMAQKRTWKEKALLTCEEGLQDRECHQIYHHDLQKRITKLEKSIKVVKREQHDFGHVRLIKPLERTVEGVRIERGPGPGSRRGSDVHQRGAKTVWLDEREGGGECSVEEMCLSWYRDEGWKGYHSEGGILRTLFAYLFYDILFLYIPNVFQTPYQTCPLDLHTDAFYESRASEINHRLVEISNGEAQRLLREVDTRERDKQTCVVGLDWSFESADLMEIIDVSSGLGSSAKPADQVKCFDGEALATICKVMAQEYRQRGGGMPDLFLWNPEKKLVMFSEVKSENDRLSDTQRLWIHVLTAAGIRVELCNAVATKVLKLD